MIPSEIEFNTVMENDDHWYVKNYKEEMMKNLNLNLNKLSEKPIYQFVEPEVP